ncbi:60S ribosomal protein L28-like [Gigantopelta aegis]|uniref:60S ribosomal protein L28-like n=1 Tax=Gigantopelta aegis TaxID=1735272 RepID=UPI001B888F0A|nr:60S ribosomal protein L28-like [Gigantopelta aegis]
MSSHLQWMIIRNNSCFLLKRNGISLSKEPNNLKNRNSFRYNGLVHKKTIGIEPAKDGKGVVLITKKSKIYNKPSKTYNKVEMKRDPRRTFATIRNTLRSKRYRKDLKMAAVRRASALLRSQKPVVVRKNLRPKKD